MSSILKIQGLSKSFGHIKAVDSIEFEVENGQVFGILGPNGSGKTTTLAVILGIKLPDRGTFSWFGGINGVDANKKIGSLLEVPYFYPYLSLEDNLKIVANVRGTGMEEIQSILKTVGLDARSTSYYYTLSLGMKQRLAIASALLGNPDVLVLDEPTNGLDPEGIAEVREIIKMQASIGKTIILASHILDEVEKVCSHVAILKNGKLIANGRVSELLAEKQLVTISAEDMELLNQVLLLNSKFSIVERNSVRLKVSIEDGSNTADLNKWLADHGVVLTLLEIQRKNLEDQFLELVRKPN